MKTIQQPGNLLGKMHKVILDRKNIKKQTLFVQKIPQQTYFSVLLCKKISSPIFMSINVTSKMSNFFHDNTFSQNKSIKKPENNLFKNLNLQTQVN